MVTKKYCSLAVLFGLALVLVSSANSQIVYGQSSTGSSGYVFTSWKLKTDSLSSTISQSWVPVSGYFALKEDIESRFYIAGSSTKLESGATNTEINGIGDARLQISKSFSGDKFLLSGGIILPTGKTELVFDEQRGIIDLLSQSFLEFPMRRYGEGFGFNLTLGGAKDFGKIVVGAGISYDYIGTFSPYKGIDKYNPGNLISADIGVNMRRDNSALAANIGYSIYLADKVAGNRVFKQGGQLDFNLAGRIDNNTYRFDALIGYKVRGRSSRYNTSTDSIADRLKVYGSEFQIRLELGKHFGTKWYLAPSVLLRKIASDELGLGKSSILSFGGSVSNRISQEFHIMAGIQVMSGDTDDGAIDLSGYQTTLSIQKEF